MHYISHYGLQPKFEQEGLKFKVQCSDEAVHPNCTHTTYNGMYFVRAAAVRSKSTQRK